MAYLLKDIFSPAFIESFSQNLQLVYPELNVVSFRQKIFDNNWQDRELKQRMRHIATVLHEFLPPHFPAAVQVLHDLFHYFQNNDIKEKVIEFCFLPDYVEQYGLDFFDESVRLMETLTTLSSCEFAVRPFILKHGDRMLQQMVQWSKHKEDKVRRLSCEGIRPRLPWAMALPQLKKDPRPILPILENLKNDPSEIVRRSVANNLNDISKDNPAWALDLFARWKGFSEATDRLIKHASRTLLKQGHKEILAYYDLHDNSGICLSDFNLVTPVVKTGEHLIFGFSIRNEAVIPKVIRLEYAVYFKKANGLLSKKVFKISERTCQPGETVTYQRKQSFRPITTRKYYTGAHRVSIITNGLEHEDLEFNLI